MIKYFGVRCCADREYKPIKTYKNFISFSKPSIGEDEIREVVDTLKSGWLVMGPKVKKFEKDFAFYKNKKNALALSSCTAALHLALLASDIKKGDEVITTPMTFCATVNVIIHSGATPILADVNLNTINIDPEEIIKKITTKTKAIIAVHFAGRPCEMNLLLDICKTYKLILIEDCAHAIESQYQNKPLGTLGDFGCFSFYITKNLVTGEGGMLLTKKKAHLDRMSKLSLHGMSANAWNRHRKTNFHYYNVEEAGYKYSMGDIQAALGIHQIKKIEIHRKRRKEIWDIYNKELKNLPILIPAPVKKGDQHAYHLYTILLDSQVITIPRNIFIQKMYELNVGLSIHYLSIPTHSYYKKMFSWKPSDFPNSQKIGESTISLPLYPSLKNDEVYYIIDCIKKIII